MPYVVKAILNDPIELRSDAVTRDTIDINDGIERLMGNRELYGRMLRRFRKDHQQGTAPIHDALTAGDMVLAHRLVHTLKGATGMIGAQRLHGHACDLELAIRLETDAHAPLAQLQAEFDKVLQLLDVLLNGSPPEGVPVAMPNKPLLDDRLLIARLTELLHSGDGAAIDLLEETDASLRVILGAETLAQVSAAVQEFDFEGALVALENR
jgi:HPt (histidine-containing phosphotransfer) domain-containing protein